MSMAPDPIGTAAHVHLRRLPGPSYETEELGVAHRTSAPDVLAALRLPGRGEIYDLDSGRWAGMPVVPVHPPFILTSYRTPRGVRNQDDLQWFRRDVNAVNMALNTELVIGTVHTGTHVDALNHVTCGLDSHWHGGYTEGEHLGDFGAFRAEASSIPPLVCRGVLADVPALLGCEILEARHLITLAELDGALQAQGVEIRPGDAVLVRTGYMRVWGSTDPAEAAAHHGSGISHDVAVTLAERGAVLVGADNEGLERVPSPDPQNPHPVHIELLVRRGIHIMELAYLEDLARDRVYEFLFVCLPLRIRGATGSMVRPVAIV